MCLAAETTEAVLHDRPATLDPRRLDNERGDLVNLKYEALLEEIGQAVGVDKGRFSSDDEHTRGGPNHGLFTVLDTVMSDSNGVSRDFKALGQRLGKEQLRRTRSEEDNLCSGGVMSIVVRFVDNSAPNAADVANLGKELVVSNVRRQVGQPESTVLLGRQVHGTRVAHSMLALVVVGEYVDLGFLSPVRTADDCAVVVDGSHGSETSRSRRLTKSRTVRLGVRRHGGVAARKGLLSMVRAQIAWKLEGANFLVRRKSGLTGCRRRSLVFAEVELVQVALETLPDGRRRSEASCETISNR